MKKLTLLLLLMPLLSFGQQFEISEQAGMARNNMARAGYTFNSGSSPTGFSNELALSWHFAKHFSAKGLYEYDGWNTRSKSVGIAPEFTTGIFYCGASISATHFSQINDVMYSQRCSVTPSYAAYFGLKERIGRHWSLTQQAGYVMMKEKGTASYQPNIIEWYSPTGTPPPGPVYISEPFSRRLQMAYLRVGISYSL